MDEVFRYRSRSLSREDIASLRDLIAQNPQVSRWRLSKLVCEAWDWRQGNGALCDMLCRSLMLALHRAGHIALPEKKQSPPNSLAKRRQPATDFALDQRPVECGLKELRPLTIRQVRRTEADGLYNGLIERFHYLGYTQPVGEHLKQIVFAGDRPVACLGLSSIPWHIGPRDKFIGWSPAVRRRNLHLAAYNTRFLILPWVEPLNWDGTCSLSANPLSVTLDAVLKVGTLAKRTRKQPGLPGTQHGVAPYRRETRLRVNATVGNHMKGGWHRVNRMSISSDRSREEVQ